jgi:hypothetical protein
LKNSNKQQAVKVKVSKGLSLEKEGNMEGRKEGKLSYAFIIQINIPV